MAEVIALDAEREKRKKRRVKFPRGRVVQLKSGGYVMTVRSIKDTPEGREYDCDYFDENGEPATSCYFEEQLMLCREK